MRKAVILAIVAAIVIKLLIIDLMIAEGDSMEPVIKSGTILVINRLQYGLRFPGQQGYLIRWASPKPGDVVVFYTPEGGLAVKRCRELIDGGFIAQGDNSLQSYDSRSYGPVPVGNIFGKALGIK
jgi:signal peptidase I